MPDPVPVMVLARLAVDRRAPGLQLGASLLQDAVNCAVAMSANAGVRALLVPALHEKAKAFYEHYGFQPSPTHPMTLMLRLRGVKTRQIPVATGGRYPGAGGSAHRPRLWPFLCSELATDPKPPPGSASSVRLSARLAPRLKVRPCVSRDILRDVR